MSCDKRCFDKDDPEYGRDDCATCDGRDDGRPPNKSDRNFITAVDNFRLTPETNASRIKRLNLANTDLQHQLTEQTAYINELRERLIESGEQIMDFKATIFARHRWINATKKLLAKYPSKE